MHHLSPGKLWIFFVFLAVESCVQMSVRTLVVVIKLFFVNLFYLFCGDVLL